MTRSPGKSEHARLFFALWPDAPVRDALAQLAASAQAECGGRAMERQKHHLTLFFLGNVERSDVAALEVLGSTIRAPAFEVRMDLLGYWRHNHIVWAGTRACPPALSQLAAFLRDALAKLGFDEEDRPYVPHVTLVRNAQRAPKNIELVPFAWRATDFALVESAPAGGGVRYDVIARWPLDV